MAEVRSPLRKLIVGVIALVAATAALGLVPVHVTTITVPATRIAVVPVGSTYGAPAGVGALAAGDDDGDATPFPLSHLALEWTGDPSATVAVRWRTSNGWLPWEPVEVNADMTAGAGSTVYSQLLRADG